MTIPLFHPYDFIVSKVYVAAYDKEKKRRADGLREELLSYDGVDRKIIDLGAGQVVDTYHFDAVSLTPFLESSDFWHAAHSLPLPEYRLENPGEETILISWGNNSLCELKYNDIIWFFLAYGFNVRTYNHPGYGASEKNGRRLTPGLVNRAGEAVYDDLRRDLGDEARILLYGISLGSFPMTHLASIKTDDNIALILDRTHLSLSDTASRLIASKGPFFKNGIRVATKRLVKRFHEYANDEKIQSYTGPLALLHGRDDEMVSTRAIKVLASLYLFSKECDVSPEELVYLMPCGHGHKTLSWNESPDPDIPSIVNQALESLGYRMQDLDPECGSSL